MPAQQPSSFAVQPGPLAQGLLLAVPLSNRLARDCSSWARPVTFVGNVLFGREASGWVLDHTETIARTNFGTGSYFSLTACTIVLAQKKTTGPVNSCAFGTPSDTTKSFGALVPYGSGTVYWDWGGTVEGTTRLSVSGLTITDDVWAFTVGPRGMEIWQNGFKKASNTATPSRTSGAGVFGLGNYTGGSDVVRYKGLLAYDRQLSEPLLRALTLDVWAPFRTRRMPMIARWASGAGAGTPSGSATLSGGGTLTASGVGSSTGAAVLSGEGTLTAAGMGSSSGAAALTATATLTASGTVSSTGSALLSGGGTMAADGTASTPGAVAVHDTFTGAAGPLLSHVGEVGAIWTRHPATAATSAFQLDGAGIVYADTAGEASYLASGVPASAEYDVAGRIFVANIFGDKYTGFLFRYDPTTDDGYAVRYVLASLTWRLTKVISGAETVLGTWADDIGVGNGRDVRIEARSSGTLIDVKFDGVSRITSTDATYTAPGRVGLWNSADGVGMPTFGVNIEMIAAGEPGFAVPGVAVTGSATLGGGGTLTASGVVSSTGSATLSGGGSLTAAATVSSAGSATLAGGGTLTADGAVVTGPDLDLMGLYGSALAMLSPSLRHAPTPVGTLDQGDRQHVAGTYSGIAAGATGAPDVGVMNLRMSMVAMAGPSLRFAPVAVATTDQADRQHLAGTYRGLLAGGAAGPDLGVMNLRMSAVAMAGPSLRFAPVAVLTTDQADRQHLGGVYRGLLAGGAEGVTGSATLLGGGVLTTSGIVGSGIQLLGGGILTASGMVTQHGAATLRGGGVLTARGNLVGTEVFLAALRTRMLAALDLNSPEDSFLSRGRAGAAFPNLVITTLFSEPFLDSSETWYEEVHCQFDLFSQDSDEANELGWAAYRSLLHRSANPPIVYTDGYEMRRRQGSWNGPTEETGGAVGGDSVWRFTFEFIFMIGRE